MTIECLSLTTRSALGRPADKRRLLGADARTRPLPPKAQDLVPRERVLHIIEGNRDQEPDVTVGVETRLRMSGER